MKVFSDKISKHLFFFKKKMFQGLLKGEQQYPSIDRIRMNEVLDLGMGAMTF